MTLPRTPNRTSHSPRNPRRKVLLALACSGLILFLVLLAAVLRERNPSLVPPTAPALADLPVGPPWRHGAANARFTVVLYGDLRCPYCQAYFPTLRAWIDTQPDVQLQWHHLPLAMHEPAASQLAVLAECAGRTGGHEAFWAAIHRAYAQPDQNVDPGSQPGASEALKACVNGNEAARAVQAQAQEATAAGVNATPTLRLIDEHSGRVMLLPGPAQGDALLSAIDMLSSPEQRAEEPAETR